LRNVDGTRWIYRIRRIRGRVPADSDEVARVKRDEAARDSWMMAPAVTE
jgi:hypothetical protein